MLQSGDRLGAFEILGQLGRGGMGEVYRARDSKLKREVALKILPDRVSNDPELLARFQREAELLAAVNHPNIAVIHSVGEARHGGAELRFLELELVEGRTLQDRITEGPVPCSEALHITHQIARALQAAHERGIVHRDLKPANVMLTSKGRIKVLDFGIAKPAAMDPATESAPSAEQVTVAPDLTAAGSLIGTTPYMSPEQIRGDDLDSRTDLWALGCVLFELLTGQRAFAATAAADIMATIMRGDPEWDLLPKDVPRAVANLVHACLAKDPEARPDSAESVRAALRQLEATPGSGEPETEQAERRQPRHTLLPMAAMLAAAAVAAAAWQLATFMGRDPGSTIAPTAGIASLVALPTILEGDASELLLGTPRTLSTHLHAQTTDLHIYFPPPSEAELSRFDGDFDRLTEFYRVDAFLMTSASVTDGETTLRVQLVDPSTRSLLWGHEYTGEVGLEELQRQAVAGLLLAMRPAARPLQEESAEPLRNPQAVAHLRLGQVYARDYNHSHYLPRFERARSAFEQALQLDPELGDAAAHLALLYQYRLEATHDDAFLDEIGAWTQLAIETSPDSAISLVMQAIQQMGGPDGFPAAITSAARATAAGAPEPIAHLVLGAFLHRCSATLAIPPLEQAVAADPLNLLSRTNLGAMYQWLGQDEKAGLQFGDSLALEPDSPQVVMATILLVLGGGQAPEPELLERLRDLATQDRMTEWQQRAAQAVADMHSTDRTGNAGGFSRAFARLRDELPQMAFNFGPEIIAAAVQVLARAGMIEEAVGLLQGHDDWLIIPYEWYSEHPTLEPLRQHPGFQSEARRALDRCTGTVEALTPLRDAGELPVYLDGPFDDLLEQVRGG